MTEDSVMSRERLPLCLAFLLFGVPGLAAPPDAHVGAVQTSSSTLSIHLQWEGAQPLPAGALIACRARVVPLAAPDAAATMQPLDTAIQVPGSAGQCALEIPLTWRGGASPAAVTVLYQMDAISAEGRVSRTGSRTIGVPTVAAAGLQLTVRL
jgi:hypothetical protein